MGDHYFVCVHSKLDLVVTVAFVFKLNRVVTIVAQHMNCAGANLALPRKCTIASDQYTLLAIFFTNKFLKKGKKVPKSSQDLML